MDSSIKCYVKLAESTEIESVPSFHHIFDTSATPQSIFTEALSSQIESLTNGTNQAIFFCDTHEDSTSYQIYTHCCIDRLFALSDKPLEEGMTIHASYLEMFDRHLYDGFAGVVPLRGVPCLDASQADLEVPVPAPLLSLLDPLHAPPSSLHTATAPLSPTPESTQHTSPISGEADEMSANGTRAHAHRGHPAADAGSVWRAFHTAAELKQRLNQADAARKKQLDACNSSHSILTLRVECAHGTAPPTLASLALVRLSPQPNFVVGHRLGRVQGALHLAAELRRRAVTETAQEPSDGSVASGAPQEHDQDHSEEGSVQGEAQGQGQGEEGQGQHIDEGEVSESVLVRLLKYALRGACETVFVCTLSGRGQADQELFELVEATRSAVTHPIQHQVPTEASTLASLLTHISETQRQVDVHVHQLGAAKDEFHEHTTKSDDPAPMMLDTAALRSFNTNLVALKRAVQIHTEVLTDVSARLVALLDCVVFSETEDRGMRLNCEYATSVISESRALVQQATEQLAKSIQAQEEHQRQQAAQATQQTHPSGGSSRRSQRAKKDTGHTPR